MSESNRVTLKVSYEQIPMNGMRARQQKYMVEKDRRDRYRDRRSRDREKTVARDHENNEESVLRSKILD